MNASSVLLLTRDPEVESALKQALVRKNIHVVVARGAGEALETLCNLAEQLDFAVIDFSEGCHGMTLLSAINGCEPSLPVIVITSTDRYRVAAIAYANGVDACLAKPVNPEELEILIEALAVPKLLLEAA